MAQISRPLSDVSKLDWGPDQIALVLRKQIPNDATFAYSVANPEGAAFEVALDPLSWPQSGLQRLQVRLRKTDAGSTSVVVILLQGNRVIAYRIIQPNQTFTTHTIDLTDAEKNAILDYTDLRVRVVAGQAITLDCEQCDTAAMQFIFGLSGIEGDQGCCIGMNHPVVLTYNDNCDWRGPSFETCGNLWILSYKDGMWVLELTTGEVYYEASGEAWDCRSALTLEKSGGVGLICQIYPDAITIFPV